MDLSSSQGNEQGINGDKGNMQLGEEEIESISLKVCVISIKQSLE